jgi:hypothetical protein
LEDFKIKPYTKESVTLKEWREKEVVGLLIVDGKEKVMSELGNSELIRVYFKGLAAVLLRK